MSFTVRVRRSAQLLAFIAPVAIAAPSVVTAAPAPPASALTGPDAPTVTLLPADCWRQHLADELMPFWMVPDAWGRPRGNFPTLRCNDGHAVDPARPCAELRGAPKWIRELAGRDFVRMKSRQAYAYGVAFHLTGDPRYLALARDGVQWIRQHALEPDGSAVSWFEGGAAGPAVLERTSQDLAYAAVGLAMYFHLTRDDAVLADLLRLKEHIFKACWDPSWGMLRWVARDPKHEEDRRQELVAQLDQINAYLLLVAPELPEPQRAEWKADLGRLAHLIVDRYWSPEQHVFWGTLHDPRWKVLGGRHVDFGHTAKALWMIERVGRLEGDEALTAFVLREAPGVLERAYLPDGSWGSKPEAGGKVDRDKSWWIYAELDQLAATLALRDPTRARYLATTYPYWLRWFVDHAGGEVWGGVKADTHAPGGGLKIHPWKSGYHSTEHALVAYLTTQALQGRPATLYFALPPGNPELRAYYFGGAVERIERTPLAGFGERDRVEVTFTQLR